MEISPPIINWKNLVGDAKNAKEPSSLAKK